jgi:competence protein ComGC
MKKLIILIIIAVFIFIFIQSNTLEITVVTKNVVARGAYISESTSREYSLHWDRFIRYIEDIPRKIGIK